MIESKETKQKPKTNGWGIDLSYKDAFQKWHETSAETVSAVMNAMGADPGMLSPPRTDEVLVIRAGEQRDLGVLGKVTLESGDTIDFERRLPADLPTGYHTLLRADLDAPSRLIVSPGKCWLPENLKTWGWSVQLYGARSRKSWGIGDFADLKRLASWSADLQGAGMMLVNPLSAAAPITPQQGSPYYPASRRFLNMLWLHIEAIPGAHADNVPRMEELTKAAHALNSERRINRDEVFRLKMEALNLLWLQFSGSDAFDEYCREHGEDLDRFATFCTLAEQYRSGWHTWPEQLQHPSDPAVARFAAENERRVRFHKWIQWHLDCQLSHCAEHLALMQDLPIGVDPDGADAWAWQDVFARNVGVGAPPDEFNTQGQDWGLPPFVPHKLRAAGYEPFIQTIRAALRNGGGLRIDHVMGLFRLFWIPQGLSAVQGTYVRYNPDEMLAIVALESERNRAYVVGEDLGTVEDGAREKLAEYGILSYRLLWFEKDNPKTYPREALAAVTTHDLPTVAGLWSGYDLKKQCELGMKPNEKSMEEIRDRLKSLASLNDDSSMEDVIGGAYSALSSAPSRILTAALDDAAQVKERPNMPATMEDRHPNWSIALPHPIEEIMEADLADRIATALTRSGSNAKK